MANEKPDSDDEQLTDEELDQVSAGGDRFNGKYLVQGVTHSHTQPAALDCEGADHDEGGFVGETKISR